MRALRLVAIGLGLAMGCDDGDDGGSAPPADDGVDRRAIVASLGEHVILPTYERFAQAATALRDAAQAHATAGPADAAAKRAAAQAAWRAAMAVWQEAEVMKVGPAGMADMTVGGQSLGDEVYSWPNVNPCRVDQEIAAGRFSDPAHFETLFPNAYGLDALEYVLFVEGADNACAPQQAPNNNGAWAALGADEIAKRRADYAAVVAGQVARDAEAIVAAWRGGFLASLQAAGTSGSAFPTARAALDEVFAAMFYVDLTTKDLKLAVPAGIAETCGPETCPDDAESQFAHVSKENIAANMRGLRAVIVGNRPGEAARPGFDDALSALGAGALATSLVADIDAAIAAVEGLEGTLQQALASDPAKVRAVHAAVKKVTDVMKSQMVSVLALTLPREGAADND